MAAQSGRGASRAISHGPRPLTVSCCRPPLGMQLLGGGTATVGGRHSWLPCFLEFPGLCAALHRLPTLPAKGSLRASDADPQQLPDFPAKATPSRAKGRIRGLPCPGDFFWPLPQTLRGCRPPPQKARLPAGAADCRPRIQDGSSPRRYPASPCHKRPLTGRRYQC